MALASQVVTAPVTFVVANTDDPDLCGLRISSDDPFTHATQRERNMLHWHNPNTTTAGRNTFCGVYARSFNDVGAGIDATATREKVGLVFRTRNLDAYSPALTIAYDGKVGIGTTSPTHLLTVAGSMTCTGSLLGGSVDAARFTTSTIPAARIPSLATSKFTTGVLADARIPSLNISTHLENTATPLERIPSLDVNKITSGTLAAARFPSFSDAQISSGAFADARIPSLSASVITSGAFPRLWDRRQLKASDSSVGSWSVGFGSWNNNNAAPFADIIHLNTWGGSSGGRTNAVFFKKDGIGIRIYQATQGTSTAYTISQSKDVVMQGSHGELHLSCNTNTVNAFEVELPSTVNASWRHFRIRAASMWGNGVTTFNAANKYTHGHLHVTIDSNVMFRRMHVVADNGNIARMRIGKAGGVHSGTWWEIGTMTNGEFVIAREASATNRVRFTSNGGMIAWGDVTAFSDARLKEDVHTIPDALDKVLALRGVEYVKDGRRSVGVLAQEVEKVFPEVVTRGEDGMLSVAYGALVGALVEAIKEQRRQREALRREVLKAITEGG